MLQYARRRRMMKYRGEPVEVTPAQETIYQSCERIKSVGRFMISLSHKLLGR